LLVVLEGLLSADNALVMAIMVLGYPGRTTKKPSLLAAGRCSRSEPWHDSGGLFDSRPVGQGAGRFLPAVPDLFTFLGAEEGEDRRQAPKATGMLGLSPFWATVVRVEAINLAFSIDSILVAVAMSGKIWVVITGGILGIVAMRLVAGKLIALVQRYPPLVDGAFIIIAWVGLKLCLEYLHDTKVIGLEIRSGSRSAWCS
jgi:predicted tellurium resistance membrane protein TerC